MIGKQLGHYAIVGQLGRGGMAIVYKAFQAGLDRPVALKILQPALAADDVIVKRFQQEARIAANLYHPGIVTIYDVGEIDGVNFIAMRYIDGENFGQFLKREGALPPAKTFEMLGQVADALDFAHGRGILHRDVKPGNVLVEDGRRLTLTDFGIARASEGANLTATRMVIGTPEYMSPEQARGDPVDKRADLYAFGVMLYEALGGRPPFSAASTPSLLYLHVHEPPPPIETLRPELPSSLGVVLAKALAKAPGDRYSTAKEIVEEARNAMRGLPTTLPATSVPTVVAGTDDTRETPPRPFSPVATPPPSPGGRAATQPLSGPSGTKTLTPPPAPVALPTGRDRSTRGPAAPPDTRPERPPRLAGPVVAVLALILVGGVVAYFSGVIPGSSSPTPTPVVSKPTAVLPVMTAVAVVPTAAPIATLVPTPAAAAQPTTAPNVAAPTVAPPTATPDPMGVIVAARSRMQSKDYPGALGVLNDLKRTNPAARGLDDALFDAHNGYGEELLAQGNLDASAAEFAEALKIRPNDSAALDGQKRVSLAQSWAAMEASWGKDDEAAIGALERIMGIDASYRDTRDKLYALLVTKADRMLNAGDRDGAYPILMHALDILPGGAEARSRLAAYTPTPAPPPPAPAPPDPAPKPKPGPAPPAPAPTPAPAPPPAPPGGRGAPV